MRLSAASAPARICLAGEDLDWLGGPSIQIALEMRIRCELGLAVPPSAFEISSAGTVAGRASAADVWTAGDTQWAELARVATALGRARSDRTWPGKLSIESAIPAGAGLASSAALCVAALAASGFTGSPEDLIDAGWFVERKLANRDVGPMDYVPCVLGGVVLASCSDSGVSAFERLCWPREVTFVVVDTGRRRDTSKVIQWKRARSLAGDTGIATYVARTTAVVEALHTLLSTKNPDPGAIGEMLDAAHSTLRDDMDVGDENSENCVRALRWQGAFGAKITGTGRGGCVFGIFPEREAAGAVRGLLSEGIAASAAKVSASGVLTS